MITSYRNPLVKRIKRLRQKKYRQQESAFFIEGLRVVLTAVEQGADVETLVFSPELLTSDIGRETVEAWADAGKPCVELAAGVFQSISEREHSAGLGAIVRLSGQELTSLRVTEDAIFVALFDIADPGNLGTILRTMDAVGAAGLILVGQPTDPFQNSVARASMGTLFAVPVVQVADWPVLFEWATSRGIEIIASSARAEHVYWNDSYQFPALLLMGSEREGLPAEILHQADRAITIPMHGRASSLNLAVATALLLYELRRPTTAS